MESNLNKSFDTDDDVSFDPYDEVSYYYGNLSREDVKEILEDSSIGTFLIRDSTKDIDQKVLCVKEAPKCINNYKIIHKLIEEGSNSKNSHIFFLYGKEDCLFSSIPNILEFYSNHYLNQSPLIKPAFYHKKCIATYDFLENGDPNEDLYFKKGEILSIIEYTQGENWWKASGQTGKVGLVPVPLIRRLKPNEWPSIKAELEARNSKLNTQEINKVSQSIITEDECIYNEELNEKCPFNARVIEDYTPSPYEHSFISLKKGQIVTVLEMRSMGKWYGQIDGKKGLFPFNRVQVIEEC